MVMQRINLGSHSTTNYFQIIEKTLKKNPL